MTAAGFYLNPVRTWPERNSNEALSHAEVRDAVERGELRWRTGREHFPPTTHPTLGADHVAYTRELFEEIVQHQDMMGSGILPNELMTKAQMIQWRDLTAPPTPKPENFTAAHDMSACPALRVVLTWEADVDEGPIEVWHLDENDVWYLLDTLAAGMEMYVHATGLPYPGRNYYSARYVSQAGEGDEWAEASANAVCPI